MRRLRAAVATGAMALALVGSVPATPGEAYPAPAPLPAVSAATLPDRYAATEQAVRDALAVARAEPDPSRVATLASLLGRDLLEFDGRGNGRAVEVIGDLVTANRVVVMVPGSHNTLDTFDRNRGPGGGARALHDEIGGIDPQARVAVLAWLGYDPPQGITLDSLTDRLAQPGGEALSDTVSSIRRVNSDAQISLLCHSYGSVVCAYALPGLPIADLVIYGSPGVGAGAVDELDTSAQVWAGRAADDWISMVPPVRLLGVGFGADPVTSGFGASPFPTGDGRHGDYHLRGGIALRSLALIVLGGLVSNG